MTLPTISSQIEKLQFKLHGYRHYYRNYKNLRILIKGLKRRPDEREWDSQVLITGYNGMGKSTLAGGINLLYDPYFSLENQAFWKEKGVQFTSKIGQVKADHPKEHKSLWLDEAKNQFDSQTPFMAVDNRESANEVNENRADKFLFTLCTPFRRNITRFMRDDRIKYWLFVYDVGRAVMIKNWVTPLGGFWHLDIIEDLIEKYKKRGTDIPKQELLRAFKKMPNTWKDKRTGNLIIIRFPDLPPGFKEDYLNWKANNRVRDYKEALSPKVQRTQLEVKYKDWLKATIYLLTKEHGYSYRKLESALSKMGAKLSNSAISRYVREYEESKEAPVPAVMGDQNVKALERKRKNWRKRVR